MWLGQSSINARSRSLIVFRFSPPLAQHTESSDTQQFYSSSGTAEVIISSVTQDVIQCHSRKGAHQCDTACSASGGHAEVVATRGNQMRTSRLTLDARH